MVPQPKKGCNLFVNEYFFICFSSTFLSNMRKISNDEDCLFFLKQDAPAALEYLIHIYFPVLCRYVEKITTNRAEAEDATEDVLIKLWDRQYF